MLEITSFSNSKGKIISSVILVTTSPQLTEIIFIGVFRGSEAILREVANILSIIEFPAPKSINIGISCLFTAAIKYHKVPTSNSPSSLILDHNIQQAWFKTD
ncbi:hypothetical protein AYI68_g7133 [Smittium mucronatum]|uniref:Uncharacterized protein n=1 Tax=Smittium mucronatum TaxID=133383 RepID=A0A1R0GPH7_9FUNG|nr:hypothetical protein AYI68_g7133 [Smittium mucronatum]